MTGSQRAAVVGGGLSGLCAGLALARTGWQVTIIERASGAGFQNAMLDVRALAASLDNVAVTGIPDGLDRYERDRLPQARRLVSSGVAWGRSYLRSA